MGPIYCCYCMSSPYQPVGRLLGVFGSRYIYLRKLECLKPALRLNNFAWNNRIGLRFYFVGFVEH
jgi:hypothetical protein